VNPSSPFSVEPERVSGLRRRVNALRRLPARRLVRRHPYLSAIVLVGVCCVAALNAFLITCGFNGCPSSEEFRAYRPTEGGRVLDRRGAALGQLVSVRRENVTLDKVPQHVRDAFLVTEDKRFYEHRGLDWRAVARAVVQNVRSMGIREGFSTITMQLARTSFIVGGRRGHPFGRKLLELRYARLLERNLSKDEILALYLNAIYLGDGVYGVQGASRDLFGKDVGSITLAEGALLAALPKAPTLYNPRNDPDRARSRRNLVLALMLEHGAIDSVAYRRAVRTQLRISPTQWANGKQEPSALTPVRAFVDSVLESLDRSGEEVVVHTTLDDRAQRAADAAVTRRAAVIQRESNAYYRGHKADIQGAMVAIDPHTGGILALVGSAKNERGGFNRALYARRQPGSAFKPFVYAAALQHGFTPGTLVDDEPVSVRDYNRTWTPANYGGEYFGTVTMRDALARSANAATVRISRSVGESNIARLAQQNGITSPIPVVPALALGAIDVTPLELVTSYAPFANRGFRVTPRLVTRIETRDGELLWADAGESKVPVLDERDAFLLTSMLRSVVDEGTGTAVRAYGVQGVVAGKTGTTNDAADVWFIGYTPTIVAGFWFGYDQPRPISPGANGGRFAAPAWAEFYRNGWHDRDVWRGWDPPRGVVRRLIDEETGLLAGDWCPRVREEWFRAGTEPMEYCSHHLSRFDDLFRRLGRGLGKAIDGLFRGGRARVDTGRGRGGGG
jgi:penicillin-binding protein 1A